MRTRDRIEIVFSEEMAKIKVQKKKKVAAKAPVEDVEVPLPSTRKSDDPIPKKVNIFRSEANLYFRPKIHWRNFLNRIPERLGE